MRWPSFKDQLPLGDGWRWNFRDPGPVIMPEFGTAAYDELLVHPAPSHRVAHGEGIEVHQDILRRATVSLTAPEGRLLRNPAHGPAFDGYRYLTREELAAGEPWLCATVTGAIWSASFCQSRPEPAGHELAAEDLEGALGCMARPLGGLDYFAAYSPHAEVIEFLNGAAETLEEAAYA